MTKTTATAAAAAGPLPVNRRGALVAFSVAATGAAIGAVSGDAIAAAAGPRLLATKGAYPVSGNRVIDGYFVAPAGGRRLDVVVIVPGPGTAKEQVEAAAREQAMFGRFGVAPNLSEDASTRRAQLEAMLPHFQTMSHASGKVRIVTL